MVNRVAVPTAKAASAHNPHDIAKTTSVPSPQEARTTTTAPTAPQDVTEATEAAVKAPPQAPVRSSATACGAEIPVRKEQTERLVAEVEEEAHPAASSGTTIDNMAPHPLAGAGAQADAAVQAPKAATQDAVRSPSISSAPPVIPPP